MSDVQKIEIVVKGFTNPYTNNPNPLNVITYPVPNVSLEVRYNGSTTPPTNTGNYTVEILCTDPNYTADLITGIYSIVGNIEYQSYGIGWGDNTSQTLNISPVDSGPTGLIGVQKIACGLDFCVALMNDNSTYTWGTGNLYGQQNIPTTYNYIKDIAVSNTTTLILDYSGNLTGCGYLFNTNGNGYTGYMPNLTGILGMSAADYYAIAVPENQTQTLVSWGNRNRTFFSYSGASNIRGATQVCATNYGFIALLDNGKVSGSGVNAFGQLYWPSSANNNIKKISCSDACTVFLYNDNTITGFGAYLDSNDNPIDFNIPASIQGHVLDINTSNSHTLVILDEYIAQPTPPVPHCTGITYV